MPARPIREDAVLRKLFFPNTSVSAMLVLRYPASKATLVEHENFLPSLQLFTHTIVDFYFMSCSITARDMQYKVLYRVHYGLRENDHILPLITDL